MIPNYLSTVWAANAPALGNHLWQSTLFVLIAGLLTLVLRKNQARTRYWLWLAASVKFLIPFSLLVGIGSHMARPRGLATMHPSVFLAMGEVGHPFLQPAISVIAPTASTGHFGFVPLLPAMLLTVWLCGFIAILSLWCVRWRRISASLLEAVPLREGREVEALRRLEPIGGIQKRIKLLLSKASIEPGIFGIARPVLVWPERISERLADPQLEAILAHEMCHVRRRDNLTAAIHVAVEAIFWFHPLVWWLEGRLLEERERACDEEVLRMYNQPRIYAESILKVCEFCVESPLVCVSGITGADLNRRLRSIMTLRVERLSRSKKLLLSALGLVAVLVPITFGMVQINPAYAQILHATGPRPSFEVATIKPSQSNGDLFNFRFSTSGFSAENVSLKRLVWFAYNISSDNQLAKGPDWMNSEKFDVDAKIADAQIEALKNLPPEQRFNQYRLMVQSLLADRFKMKVSTEIKALPVYALVVAKSGPKLTPASLPVGTQKQHMPWLTGGSRGELNASAVPMAFFAKWLSGKPDAGGRTVIDATGLQGSYDFTLKWSPADMSSVLPDGTGADGGAARAPVDSSEPSLFTVLQDQLGLKLEPRKAPVEVLVVDHVEQPSEN